MDFSKVKEALHGGILTRKTRAVSRVILSLLLVPAAGPGCSLIFGGDQKVDNKSHDYSVVRLDHDPASEWRVLVPSHNEANSESAQVSNLRDPNTPTSDDTGDLAFEHVNTGTIISVDSVCREYRDAPLEDLSRYLLMGLNTHGQTQTHEIDVNGIKGLDSTVEALMTSRSPSAKLDRHGDEHPVRVRAVVLKHQGCVYDLMYIAKPADFEKYATSFERFLKGFHAK